MGRKKPNPNSKENRATAFQAAKEAASAQLRAAKGVTSQVKWSQIAKEHGVDRTTLRAHVAGHGGVVRQRVGAGGPLLLPESVEKQLADWLVMTAVAKKSPSERQVLDEAKRLAATHKLQAADQLCAAATSALPAADVAAAAASAVAALQGNSLAEVDPDVAEAAGLQLLAVAAAAGRTLSEEAVALLRGERKLAPQRQGKGKKRLSYWVTGPEWQALHEQEQQAKRQKEEEAAAKKVAAAAKREAAAATRAEKAQRAQQGAAGKAAPKQHRHSAGPR